MIFLTRQMKQSGRADHSANEVAALKRQIEDLQREIERLKESHKPPG
jgi:phage host-nuclease inhibitor protein Gam